MIGPPNARHAVSLQQAAPRSIAAVHARLSRLDVPRVFAHYLDQVYAAARGGSVQLDGQNVFIYRDVHDRPDQADVSFGVGVKAPFEPIANVLPTTVPGGYVATATHWGSYARLGAAHQAVLDWCRMHGHRLAGSRWEVYGHWTEDEAKLRTDVYYLLASPTSAV
ncbi:MAG: GyrI-like domain-containing protein [Gemmatimonadaceae bacterium]